MTTEIDPRNLERDAAIMDGARRLIRERGLSRMTRGLLADYSGCSPTSISNFGRVSVSTTEPPAEGYRERLLKALMAQAVVERDVVLLGAGLTDGCLSADSLPGDLRAVMGV